MQEALYYICAISADARRYGVGAGRPAQCLGRGRGFLVRIRVVAPIPSSPTATATAAPIGAPVNGRLLLLPTPLLEAFSAATAATAPSWEVVVGVASSPESAAAAAVEELPPPVLARLWTACCVVVVRW